MGILDELANLPDSAIDGVSPPSEKLVDWLHSRAGLINDEDIHHPLGNQHGDGSHGDHIHDGKNGRKILSPEKATLNDVGPSASDTDIRAAINALNAALRVLGAG